MAGFVLLGLVIAAAIGLYLAKRYDQICRASACFQQSSSYLTTARGRKTSYALKAIPGGRLSPPVGSVAGTQVWREPKGAHRVQVVATVANTGSFGVTVDSVELPAGIPGVRALHAAFYKAGAHGRTPDAR